MKKGNKANSDNVEYQLALLQMNLDLWVKKLERELTNKAAA